MKSQDCPPDYTKIEPYLRNQYSVVDYTHILIDGQCIPYGARQHQGTLPECEAFLNLRKKDLL